MVTFSTRQAARKLGLSHVALAHYIKTRKIPEPQIMNVGGRNIHVWTEEEIAHVRQLLPKIANGRKTRYKKKHSAVRNQQSVKAKTPPRAAVPHKTRNKKK